jgi:hypothetical protein
MATIGLSGYLTHAAAYGCSITYAHTGDPFPMPTTQLTGKPDARNNLIALGVAVDPEATIHTVMLHTLMNPDEENTP